MKVFRIKLDNDPIRLSPDNSTLISVEEIQVEGQRTCQAPLADHFNDIADISEEMVGWMKALSGLVFCAIEGGATWADIAECMYMDGQPQMTAKQCEAYFRGESEND